MSVNASSSSNSSLRPLESCSDATTSTFIVLSYSITKILLLLPLFIFILHQGYKRWRKQRSATTHSDIFTYNMVVMEIIGVLGCGFFCCGVFNERVLKDVGLYFLYITFSGQNLFHCLTCVDCYLAVSHPVTYLNLKQRSGVKIRNIAIGCIWLVSLGWMKTNSLLNIYLSIIRDLFLVGIPFAAIFFCCLSVVCALIRPGPGEVGGDRRRADQSKQRAVHTIMVIMVVLFLRFGGTMVYICAYFTLLQTRGEVCSLLASTLWLSLPSSLVLPLLFLHRAGKLPSCKNKPETG